MTPTLPAIASPALDRARRKAFRRLLPVLFISYFIAYVDRNNVAIAALTMPNDLPWLNKDVLVPLYNETRGGGSHGEYRIVGFASFKVLGYKIKNDNPGMPGNGKCSNTPGNSGSCLYGEFSKVTTTDSSGGGPDYGARTISMIG